MKIKIVGVQRFFLGSEYLNNHIVRVNEKIEKIASIYNLSVDEIKKINTHIRDWNNLLPGTKLRLPEISDILNNQIDNVEPFIEEYYPRINKDSYVQKEDEIIPIEPVKNDNYIKEPIEHKKKNKMSNMYNNPYAYYYNYPYNQYKRITNKKRKTQIK